MRPIALAFGGLLLGAALGLAPAAQAQTTHVVQLFTVSFFPQDITIEVGDTVRWEWVTGVHDVKSGPGGVPDGIFNSGNPTATPPGPFEVTFDAAFLAANPVANDVYAYYCTVHLPIMTGTVTVVPPAVNPSAVPYGSGVNPAGSLSVISGEPKLGTTFVPGVANTAIPNSSAAFAFLAFSLAPFPNGFLLPGYGMSGPGAPGELLIDVLAPNYLFQLGPKPWAGGLAPPAPFGLGLPPDPAFAGATLYLQGVLAYITPTLRVTLSNGLAVTLGT
jgi:plastocyanin